MQTSISYKNVHTIITGSLSRIRAFKPDVIVAIGGGGLIPARVLRTHLKIPILVVTLKLYNENDTQNEHVDVIQWLDGLAAKRVCGKRILVVDEVDDTRTTLLTCLANLRVRNEPAAMATFVLYNKNGKEKAGSFPKDVVAIAGREVDDVWLNFPWESK